ncbi:MAG TPA: hypothetical protein VJR89_18735 [Polyangiales bacterium]|nr:hypothetical protein [Polyangiales bacterium]
MSDSERPAHHRWVIQSKVFIFYGNGGIFTGEPFERWFQALQGAPELRLYVGAAGSGFSFGPQDRARATEYFKVSKLRFAVITESVRLRLLGQTARLVGMNLGLYGWADSHRPFVEAGFGDREVDQLHETLVKLRVDVDTELKRSREASLREAG